MNKISAVVIAKNEEVQIGKCLESVSWCDERIVVVDDRTTDQTALVARRYTNRVLVRKWLGYGKQKNFAINRASHEWILSLDADERVTPKLANEIQQVLKNPEYEGYYILFHTYIGKQRLKYGGMQSDWHLRLFKKSAGYFQGKFQGVVHESVEVNNAGYLQEPMVHYTYKDRQEFLEKVKKYSALEAQELLQSGVTLGWKDKVKPVLRFVNIYFRKLGILDRWLGLVNAYYLSYYLWRRNRFIRKGLDENWSH